MTIGVVKLRCMLGIGAREKDVGDAVVVFCVSRRGRNEADAEVDGTTKRTDVLVDVTGGGVYILDDDDEDDDDEEVDFMLLDVEDEVLDGFENVVEDGMGGVEDDRDEVGWIAFS